MTVHTGQGQVQTAKLWQYTQVKDRYRQHSYNSTDRSSTGTDSPAVTVHTGQGQVQTAQTGTDSTHRSSTVTDSTAINSTQRASTGIDSTTANTVHRGQVQVQFLH
jgi:hypothetical protein